MTKQGKKGNLAILGQDIAGLLIHSSHSGLCCYSVVLVRDVYVNMSLHALYRS